MKNSVTRILTGGIIATIGVLTAYLQSVGYPAVRYVSIAIVLGMIIEFSIRLISALKHKTKNKISGTDISIFVLFFAWLIFMLFAASNVGTRPWIVLLLVLIICAADIGAWFFGKLIGGDKMWENISANKTWAGQIMGVVCGTVAAVMYGLLGTDTFMPQLLWIGISIALLSQYGDLLASWIKRKMGLKDFGTLLPGHGGLLDRFDGWIIVLPLVWLVMI